MDTLVLFNAGERMSRQHDPLSGRSLDLAVRDLRPDELTRQQRSASASASAGGGGGGYYDHRDRAGGGGYDNSEDDGL